MAANGTKGVATGRKQRQTGEAQVPLDSDDFKQSAARLVVNEGQPVLGNIVLRSSPRVAPFALSQGAAFSLSAWSSVFKQTEAFYNQASLHVSLGYKAPFLEFDTDYAPVLAL